MPKEFKKINRPPVSAEEVRRFKELKAANPAVSKKVIFSFFTADRYDCECQPITKDLLNKFSSMSPAEVSDIKFKMEYIRCPRNKKDMSKFRIHCQNCNALVGECYATDSSLEDYCDFHYISYFTVEEKEIEVEIKEEVMDKEGHSLSKFITKKVKQKVDEAYWQGAFGVNISPTDLKIGIECACGNDTRDFRGNKTLPRPVLEQKVKDSMYGRNFGRNDSRYLVVPIKD